MVMDFRSGSELLQLCKEYDLPISEIMILREEKELGVNREEALKRMGYSYQIMKRAATKAIEEPQRSIGGLIGGEAARLHAMRQDGKSICGTVISKAITYAMGVMEVNASMGLIVAAPTAGSSGIIPGVFLSLQEEYGFTDEEMVIALFNTAAVGYLIMRNATVSGAQGGCQAEVGSSSAMAAAAITELMGGSPKQCLSASAIAISNLMGVVCDPIGGLVEAPCQTRNSVGASNAFVCAEIALSGAKTVIPFDEIVEASYQVGLRMPVELRETALGGAAATPTACSLCKGS